MKNKKIIFGLCTVVILISIIYFNSNKEFIAERKVAATTAFPTVELGEVWGAKQDQVANEIVATTKKLIEMNQKQNDRIRRDAHPKTHGCVKAQWTPITSNLKPELKTGVFAETQTIPAWIRFSNGASDGLKVPDSKPDVRGFAIKLMTPQRNQDFLMVSLTRFFSRDSEDYFNFSKAISEGSVATALYFLTNIKNGIIIKSGQIKIKSVLEAEYFSPVPSKLGNQSMRFKVTPCQTNFLPNKSVDENQPNYLSESLFKQLSTGTACFDFYVQPNNDPKLNKLEDPTLTWNEEKSPFVKVARIDIEKQNDFGTNDRLNFCDNLSFNPWHTYPENRPLGQINRTRKLVYEEISKFRHSLNKTLEMEPTDHSACTGSAAALCR